MGGIFGVTSKSSCTLDLFFGTDYHSHLGTRTRRYGRIRTKRLPAARFTILKTLRSVQNLNGM